MAQALESMCVKCLVFVLMLRTLYTYAVCVVTQDRVVYMRQRVGIMLPTLQSPYECSAYDTMLHAPYECSAGDPIIQMELCVRTRTFKVEATVVIMTHLLVFLIQSFAQWFVLLRARYCTCIVQSFRNHSCAKHAHKKSFKHYSACVFLPNQCEICILWKY